jgi:hypothetical protein
MMSSSHTPPGRRAALKAAEARLTRHSPKKSSDQPVREAAIAFSYLRVSTKEQARTGGGAEGYSIPAQRSACLTKAAELGAVLEREYVDAGESARSAHRDQLQQMLTDIKTVRPDYLIVHKIDRLARNRAVTGQVAEIVSCQGRPSASMTRVSKKCLPCLAAVER